MKLIRSGYFARLFGVDRAVAYTLLGRGWGMVSGLITLWFISKTLSPVEQGFYYTFASVLALQVVFELGMSFVVMQFASHEMADLAWSSEDVLDGDDKAKGRLRSLLVLVVKWYGAISLLIAAVIMPAGWIFFEVNGSHGVTWQFAWVWLVIAAALNILTIPVCAMLEGCGRVAEVARMRMAQGVVASVSGWVVFALGGGLLAMPVMSTVMLMVAAFWLWFGYRAFIEALLSSNSPDKISWRAEIWPLQWKIALSWLSGYLMLQLFVPVLFSYRGPVEAGQMGMSLSIAAALLSVSFAWVNTKAPTLGKLVASGRYSELDSVFFRAMRQSSVVALLGCSAVLIGKCALAYWGSRYNDRLLPTLPFFLLLLTVVINNLVFAESVYLRAHKAEPFMWMSIAVGASVAAITLLVGKQYGGLGMMTGYVVVSLVVGLGWGSWIFQTKRLEWHKVNVRGQVE